VATKKTLRQLSYKPSGEIILPQIRRHVMREVMRPNPNRDMSYVHPSEMVKSDWCPRRAYHRINGDPAGESKQIDFRIANIFAEGHEIHARWQTWLWDMGVLWGRWKCKSCKETFYDLSPAFCPCGGDLRYAEVPLWDKEHHIIGHADGAVLCEDGKVRLIEIKSIGIGTMRFEAPRLFEEFQNKEITLDQLWMKVKRPLPSHLKQGNIYLAIAPKCHEYLADTDEIIFLYEWKATQETRELVFKFRLPIVQELLDDARSVRASLEAGTPPERPYWAAETNKSCKECEYKAVCWGQEPTKENDEGEPQRAVRRASGRRRKALGST
jgi:hypothetical protein